MHACDLQYLISCARSNLCDKDIIHIIDKAKPSPASCNYLRGCMVCRVWQWVGPRASHAQARRWHRAAGVAAAQACVQRRRPRRGWRGRGTGRQRRHMAGGDLRDGVSESVGSAWARPSSTPRRRAGQRRGPFRPHSRPSTTCQAREAKRVSTNTTPRQLTISQRLWGVSAAGEAGVGRLSRGTARWSVSLGDERRRPSPAAASAAAAVVAHDSIADAHLSG